MLARNRSCFLMLFFIGLVNLTGASASTKPITTEETAALLSKIIPEDEKAIKQLTKLNKKLVKDIRGLPSGSKSEVTKDINKLAKEEVEQDAVETDTIKNAINDSLTNPITTKEIADFLVRELSGSEKPAKKLIKSNKKLINNIKGLTPSGKSALVKTIDGLDRSITGNIIDPDIIENTLDSLLNDSK